jgi:2-polyprenyl-3-methyl-5-hydroxy-6-metoxy-1,4-benzoquinol methylase
VLDGSPCIVCGHPRRVRVAEWSARCDECGTWASNLPVEGSELDTDTRVAGYEGLRRDNFRIVLDRLSRLRTLESANVLDVGSAYGWFLQEATNVGAVALGIEPDDRVAARSAGQVLVGRFPGVLAAEERFDVIAFNDALEHIPDVRGALETCRLHLRPGGLLSVNIPTANGLGFRVARGLARLGINGPYQRMWQYGLASPHLHYFSTRALVDLIDSCNLRVRAVRQLPAITRKGLWHRVHTVRRASAPSVLGFACLYAAASVLNRPGCSDIVHVIAERTDD